ncbi:hypothetical protein ACVOMV_03850 [Mesorhizobium atlanticum]
MNGVLGIGRTAGQDRADAAPKTFTDVIVKSGNALLTIINDILDFSKINAGQLTLDPAPSAWRKRSRMWRRWCRRALPKRTSSSSCASIRACRPLSWAMQGASARSSPICSATP